MKRIVLAALLMFGLATPAYATTHVLVAEWFQSGNQMCRYENGTVLNVGANTCPLSIQGPP